MDADRRAARARSFGAVAEVYARSRAAYPDAAVRWVLEAGPHACRVLDLGAGTGRLSEALLRAGVEVVAVEPDEAMRAHVPVGALPLAGTAEQVPLEDASVDAVLVGQAWHWFDQERATAEVDRVLRPGGVLGLLWNVFDDAVPWVAEVAGLLRAEDRASAELPDPGRLGPFAGERRRFAHVQPMTRDLLVDNAASRSGVVLLPPGERAALLERVAAAAPADTFTLPWVCDVWRGTRA